MLNDAEKPSSSLAVALLTPKRVNCCVSCRVNWRSRHSNLTRLGRIISDHPLMIGRMGCQAGHRYGNAVIWPPILFLVSVTVGQTVIRSH